MKTDSAQIQYDKMTKTPVNKLVLQLGLPTTVSMLVTSVYNMADTFFVSQLGTSVSGATGVVFALMAIINAFGFMFGHGAGSNISRKLGAHDVESARKFASTSFFLSLLCGALICILGFLFHAPFMRLLGSTDSILPHAIEYSTWILIAAPAMASSCVMNNILRYEGKAFFAMLGLASGGILNIFGDMFLIFVLKLGVRGAGISTAISQYISMAILISPFLRGKVQSRLNIRYVTRQFSDVSNILATGFPSLMRQGLNSVSVMVLNRFAGPYGDAAIAAMSIVTRIINFLFCVALGIGQGFQPVSAFNYGAGKYKRIYEGMRKGFFICIFISLAASAICVFGGRFIVSWFVSNPSEEIFDYAMQYLNTISFFMLPLAWIFLYRNALQGLNRGLVPMLSGVVEMVCRIIVIAVTLNPFGYWAVRLASPITWLFTGILLIVTYFIWEKQSRKKHSGSSD